MTNQIDIKKLDDPRFYLENLCRIKGKSGAGLEPFIFKPAQLDIINVIQRHNRVMIMKARQIGFSTVVTGYLYHKTITTSGITTAIVGYNNDMTAELLDKIKTFYRTTPDSLKPTIQYNSKYEISFPKMDSKIMVLPSTENVARGYTVNYCLSENTRIIMGDFSEKKIKNIKKDDRIINGKGGFSDVYALTKKKNTKKLIKISSYGADDLVLTEDHKVLTRNFLTKEPIWKEAGKLKKGDYLAYPYLQCENKVEVMKSLYSNQGGGYWKRGKCYYWSKIDSVEESEYEKYVYDISLKDDPHSFLTHAGVVHNCLLTELPFWEKVEGKMTTLEASVPVNGKIVIESSPGAVGDYFHRMWVSENDYIKKEYGWWWNYTEEEVETIRRRMDNERQFNNNYALEFLISGRSVFTQETIAKQRKNVLKVGDSVKLENGTEYIVREEDDGFRMYKPVEDGHQYVAGADCAEGVTGGDYSVCSIIDRGSGEEVGFYRDRIASDRFAKFLNKWGRYYNNALMVVESEAHGNVVLNVLKQLLYPSLYFRPANFDTIGNPWSDKLGWKTTRVTRPILIDEFEQMTREGSLKVHSKETVDEMTVFVFNDANNMVAMESYFDDCIFATAIACQGFKVLSDKPLDQINYARHLPYSGY